MPAILQVNGLCLHVSHRVLFDNWSTCIQPGLTYVCGGENSGKTTLLRLMAGDLPASAGSLSINGISLHDQPETYNKAVFWMDPRSNALDPSTPADYFKSLPSKYPKFDPLLLAELIEGLSLSDHLHKNLFMLSAGSKRKVWLAAAFASGAVVTLIDKPFAALDMTSIGFLKALLTEAADHPSRAWVIADYAAPDGVKLAAVLDLDG